MCGRFVSSSPPDELAKYFDVEAVAESVLEPSFNVAPSRDIYVVVKTGGLRRLETFRWGLVPFWAKDPATGNKMINARAESIAEKNAYKRAFTKRRCIIPADGFYEWKKVPAKAGQKARKQPYFIHRGDGEPMALAGLWAAWKEPGAGEDADWTRTCIIITTDANATLRPVHDRMPVILPPEAWDTWLDPENHDVDALSKLLVPAPEDVVEMYEVSTKVSNARNEGSELVTPLDDLGDGAG